ncbi:hypothetical protein [Martelella soudanensis]|uniref:hypothetical protein n=1 Tax=unclassified Martelella TaxID=2629616 RepID=UPI0015DDB412|nr:MULTISPECIES: hypothetical protein [unclassified Martelella]
MTVKHGVQRARRQCFRQFAKNTQIAENVTGLNGFAATIICRNTAPLCQAIGGRPNEGLDVRPEFEVHTCSRE